jgi:serine/threonine-protein kinase RsbW
MNWTLRENAAGLQKIIPSTLEAVDEVCSEIKELMKKSGLDETVFPVELTARECLNNAVIHGNSNDISKKVYFDFKIGRKWIWLRVKDEGKGFDWRRKKNLAPDDNKKSGRGLFINRSYASRMTFNQAGNQITLRIIKIRKED